MVSVPQYKHPPPTNCSEHVDHDNCVPRLSVTLSYSDVQVMLVVCIWSQGEITDDTDDNEEDSDEMSADHGQDFGIVIENMITSGLVSHPSWIVLTV